MTCHGANALLLNAGGESFEEVAVRSGVADAGWGTSARFGDLDGDGDVDLYVCNYVEYDFENPPAPATYKGQLVLGGPHGMTPEKDVVYENVTDENRDELRKNDTERISKEFEFEISTSENALSFLPFVDSEVKREGHIVEDGPRSCWSVTDLGNWGFVLMGAELGGGRETAMLTGGAAGIPAWWMAFISLSLSVISLFLAYPVMYKLYHQETDDMLSRTHIRKVVADVLRNTERRLHIKIDWDLYKIEVRDLSIDIMVPYSNTDGTFSDVADVRSDVLKEV